MNMIYASRTNTEYSRAQLAGLITPPPMGSRHFPYSFEEFVETIHHGLDQAGIEVIGEEYVTSHENMRLFGALELEIPAMEGEFIAAGEDGLKARDHRIVLGLRGSHDQSITRGLAIGSQVMICSNLCFSGNLGNIATKQTTNIGARLPGLIRNAVDCIPAEVEHNVLRFDRYRNTPLPKHHGDAALIEIHRRGGLSGSQISRAVKEWDNPSHSEHAEQDYSIWRLFNACTEAVKPSGANSNPEVIYERTGNISSYLDSVVGLERLVH